MSRASSGGLSRRDMLKTTGGIATPIAWEKGGDPAKELQIDLAMSKEDNSKGRLTIRFGPHTLTAPVTVPAKP